MATDINRWTNNAKEIPRWDERNRLISTFCKAFDAKKILDFGAGNQTLKAHLGDHIQYKPIDCIATTEDTFICDYNIAFNLPDLDADTILVFSGFLEYIVKLDDFLQYLRRDGRDKLCVFSYAVLPINENQRLKNGWLNHLGESSAVIKYFHLHFYSLKVQTQWNGQLIFTGNLRPL